MDEMVKRRCDEINSAEMMKQIIIEEWDALPFDDSEADDGWIGFEALVDKWEAILQSVVDCEGWDTPWMK